jgi:hypothetical protein
LERGAYAGHHESQVYKKLGGVQLSTKEKEQQKKNREESTESYSQRYALNITTPYYPSLHLIYNPRKSWGCNEQKRPYILLD